jgi:hypothetical protein
MRRHRERNVKTWRPRRPGVKNLGFFAHGEVQPVTELAQTAEVTVGADGFTAKNRASQE